MGMTRNDNPDAGCVWIEIESVAIVENTDGESSGRNKFNLRQLGGPLTAVHITAYGYYRCQADHGIQDLCSTDVSGMNDGIDAGKKLCNLRVQPTVGVRDNAQSQALFLNQIEIGSGRDTAFPFSAVFEAQY